MPKILPKANTVWNCRRNKNMLEDNRTSQECPYTPKGVLEVIKAAWVEDNIWKLNKSVTLSSKLELCEADIEWLNIFSNLKPVNFGMKHSCRMKKFQLFNLLSIDKIFPEAKKWNHLIINLWIIFAVKQDNVRKWYWETWMQCRSSTLPTISGRMHYEFRLNTQ